VVRTWNSLWSNMNPPEQSGIFGNGWRSNFEERIQTLTGGVVKYWKGNGSSIFYSYDSLSQTYSRTAPLNEYTNLSYDSGAGLWTISQQDGTRRIFNSAGYLTSVVDRNGNVTTINVDSANQNRIASVTDPAGRILTFNYTNGTFPRLCTSVVDASGTVATYTYDTSGRLSQVAYPDGSQFNFSYNSSNLILNVTDAQSKVIEAHTYDTQRRGLTSQRANDSTGKPVEKVTANYRSTYPWNTTVCDSLAGDTCASVTLTTRAQRHFLSATGGGTACSSCSFEQGAISKTFSSSGDITSYTDQGGHTTTYSYDSQGNVIQKSLPDAGGTWDTWNYTYNSFGEVLTTTDPLGNVTTNQYDVNGNLLSTTSPSPDGVLPGSSTTFTYDSHGQLLTITDPLNHITTIDYYPTGLIHTVTDAQNHVTTYVYDARGNRTSVTDAVSTPTNFQYDSMNRLTLITYSDQSTVQFGYDYRGRRTSITDQNSKITQYGYDDADRLISVTDPANHVTQYVYNTENDLTDIYDASNNHTVFTWTNGRTLQKTTFPSGFFESYTWNFSAQNLGSRTDRNGNTQYFFYDVQNRLYQWASTLTATYDRAGRLSQVTDTSSGTSTWTFSYDGMSRLKQTTAKYSYLTRTFTTNYGYDAASNRTNMTDPESGVTQYTYDSLNRLTNLQDFQSHNFGFSYDALSRRTQLTRPNGVNTNYSYDNLSRLLSVLHQVGVTTLDGAVYTYDAAGNRMSKADQQSGITSNFGYDAIYQLSGVTQGPTTTESYTYDAVGNRLSSLGVSPYTYNSSNQLLLTPTTTYTYDKNGNTKTKVDATGTTTYNWDTQRGFLTSVVLPGTGGTVSFKYDPFGRRIQKSSPSGTVNYVYDGANILEETDNSGIALARYTQGQGVDQPLAQLRSNTTSYYEQDGLGSVTSLSDGGGNLANTYTYDTFGQLSTSSGTLTNPFRYTGREFDSNMSLQFSRARLYDSMIGRFISEDPSQFNNGDLNLYIYVDNQPTYWIDPTGLIRCARGVNCDFQPDLLSALECFERCGGHEITITCGTDNHPPTDPHSQGEAADIGRNSNPSLDRSTAETCYSKCFKPKSYAQEEENGKVPGTHYHIQNRPGRNGGTGFAPGVQPHAPYAKPRS
jgi:RHS repeat-associated protein